MNFRVLGNNLELIRSDQVIVHPALSIVDPAMLADSVEEVWIFIGVAAFDEAEEVVVMSSKTRFSISVGRSGVLFVDNKGLLPEGSGGRNDAEIYGLIGEIFWECFSNKGVN